MTEVRTVADAEALRDRIEDFASEGWATDPATGGVDWEEWANRFEAHHPDIDLGDSMLTPAFRRVQRIARDAIDEAHS